MVSKFVVIRNKLGLHARPCSLVVKTASMYQSKVMIIKDDMEVNAKSIMGLMMLAAEQGSQIELIVDGPDEEFVMTKLIDLFESRFGEE
ncbi:MAG: HPr family phosphocarrier protein [Candidatus Cloacimonetes bacterium]|nr:HPr family phosphocarrier protein [Candidatus Cloacimonadota bacterium]